MSSRRRASALITGSTNLDITGDISSVKTINKQPYPPVAASCPYDNGGGPLISNDVQGAIDELTLAENVTYDNTTSLLAAADVQAALDEIDAAVDAIVGAAAGNLAATLAIGKFTSGTDIVVSPNDQLLLPDSLVSAPAIAMSTGITTGIYGSSAELAAALAGVRAMSLTSTSTLLGLSAIAGSGAVALGVNADSNGANTIAIGDATATGATSIAMGLVAACTVAAAGGVAIGADATSSNTRGVAIGENALASGTHGTAVGGGNAGNGAIASGTYSTALGPISKATNSSAVAVGASTTASGPYAVAMGNGATASHDDSVALGRSISSAANGSFNTIRREISNGIASYYPAMFIGNELAAITNSAGSSADYSYTVSAGDFVKLPDPDDNMKLIWSEQSGVVTVNGHVTVENDSPLVNGSGTITLAAPLAPVANFSSARDCAGPLSGTFGSSTGTAHMSGYVIAVAGTKDVRLVVRFRGATVAAGEDIDIGFNFVYQR